MITNMKTVNNKLIRGSRPSSHKELIELGCTAVINLESGAYEKFHNDEYEIELPAKYNLNSLDLKCSDISPPSKLEVDKFLYFIESNKTTYVHCLHGKDRTGFMCAAYRMRVCNWTFKAAIQEMFEMGFHKSPYIWWVPFLLMYRK